MFKIFWVFFTIVLLLIVVSWVFFGAIALRLLNGICNQLGC